MDAWKEKLIALCEGLELRNIDMMLNTATIDEFRLVGSVIAQRMKGMKNEVELTSVCEVRKSLLSEIEKMKQTQKDIVHNGI